MDVEKKPLSELKVVDLKRELEKRGLDKNGVKLVLTERLSKALTDEGHDPDSYLFEIPTGKQVNKGDESMNSEKSGTEDGPEEKEEIVEESRKPSIEPSHEEEDEADGNNAEKEEDSYLNNTTDMILLINEDDECEDSRLEDESANDAGNDRKEADSKEKDDELNDTGDDFIVKDQVSDHEEKNKETPQKETKEGDGGDEVHNEAEGNADAGDATGETKEAAEKTEDGEKPEEEATEKSGAEGEGEGSKDGQEGKCPGANLWVSNLSQNTKATDLKRLFSRHGKLIGAKIVTSARTPGSRCYGYVTMSNTDDADRCIQFLHRVELHGRMISVERAKDDATGPLRRSVAKDRGRSPRRKSEHTPKEGEPERERSQKSKSNSQSRSKPRSSGRRTPPPNVLSFSKIKRERERQRAREIEHRERELAKRRREQAEELRLRERERRQREEATRLEREKQRLRHEREKLEREKEELLRLERERQRLESERIAREREELRKRKIELTPSGKRGNDDKRQDYPSKRQNLDKDNLLDPPPAPRFSDNDRPRDRYRGNERRIDDRRGGKDDGRQGGRYDASKDNKNWSSNGTQYKSYGGSGGYNREVWSTRNSHWANQDPNSRRNDGDVVGRASYMGGAYPPNQYIGQPPPPGVEHPRYQDPRFDGYAHSLPVRKY